MAKAICYGCYPSPLGAIAEGAPRLIVVHNKTADDRDVLLFAQTGDQYRSSMTGTTCMDSPSPRWPN